MLDQTFICHFLSGSEKHPGFSLSDMVGDVSQRGCNQAEALEENLRTLSSLQVHI